jgi:hypothetical protein
MVLPGMENNVLTAICTAVVAARSNIFDTVAAAAGVADTGDSCGSYS